MLKKYKSKLAIVIAFLFVQVMADLYLPTLMSDIVDKGIVKDNGHLIIRIGLLMFIVAGVGTTCAIISNFISSKVAVGFGRDIRQEIFSKVESFSLQEFDKFGTATLITRATNDVTQIQQVTILIISMMITAPLTAIGGIFMALQKDVKLTLILAVIVPILGIAVAIVLVKGIHLFGLVQQKVDRLNLVVRESLTGIRVVRAFNQIDKGKKEFNTANRDIMENTIKVNNIMAILIPLMMLIMNLTIVSIIWFGAIRIDDGDMKVGELIAFIQYAMQILSSFAMLSMLFMIIPRAQASAVRINEVLETNPKIVSPITHREIESIKGYVEFEKVTFNYPGAELPAVQDISFIIGPGETTAIIGGTGSGKSTLVHLIMRFYDVSKGRILVDGVDIREVNIEILRQKIGLVPQKTVLFSGSISHNIQYGKKDATLKEMNDAAGIAQSIEFINSLEKGFEHNVSQGGTNVSGGQKQRIAIARALVRKPEIYIFDDSFSALDFKTDARLRASLKNETKEAAVLIVAQRVSTVMDADRILVLDEGRIVGMGKHEELMNTCDVYSEIVFSQLSKEELA